MAISPTASPARGATYFTCPRPCLLTISIDRLELSALVPVPYTRARTRLPPNLHTLRRVHGVGPKSLFAQYGYLALIFSSFSDGTPNTCSVASLPIAAGWS